MRQWLPSGVSTSDRESLRKGDPGSDLLCVLSRGSGVQPESPTGDEIYKTARLAFSAQELRELAPQELDSLIVMIKREWKRTGKQPPAIVVEGFKELLGHLWHPAFSALQDPPRRGDASSDSAQSGP